MTDINWLAVFIGSLVPMLVGFMWYSPMLFGKLWMKLTGMTKEKMEGSKKERNKMYAMSYVPGLIMAFTLAMFMQKMGSETVMDGVTVAFWAWLGFTATVQATGSLFGGKSKELFFLDTGFQLVSMVLTGVVIAVIK